MMSPLQRIWRRGVAVMATATAFAVIAVDASAFELYSRDIAPHAEIDTKFVLNSLGCNGRNVSPDLIWRDPPAQTKSFAIIVDDPDAPTRGVGFTHWIVADIPAAVLSAPQGAGGADGRSLPPGSRQFENDFGDVGWGGPCPPPGRVHNYAFVVYALSIERLVLPTNARAAAARAAIERNALAKATFVARYGR